MKKNSIGFWIRLLAFLIDVFCIYSITELLLLVCSFIRFRISFEVLFILVGALYSFLMILYLKQTVGKMLLKIEIASERHEFRWFRRISSGEFIGRWTLSVALLLSAGVFLTGCLLSLLYFLVKFQISLETVFIVAGALYSFLLLIYLRAIVKRPLRPDMVSENQESVHPCRILVREIIGKWGLSCALPIGVGVMLTGNYWFPTAFDLLICILVFLLMILYFSITKHTWYEQLSGLTIKKSDVQVRMTYGFYALLICAFMGIGSNYVQYRMLGRIPSHLSVFQSCKSTGPYVDFLNKQKTLPVDYVISLFDQYDVVVLAERDHREMTQWDFIFDIIKDPRFIEKAGTVFTEYGQTGMQEYLDNFMNTDHLSDEDVHNRVVGILRNMPIEPCWTNYNIYNYFKKLYTLNQKLLPGKRIRHFLTDEPVDWSKINSGEDYGKYLGTTQGHRDNYMAQTIIDRIQTFAKASQKTPKCLVIMNSRHGMDLTKRDPDIRRRNTYEILKDTFENKAANVLINGRLFLPFASGVWEDAFTTFGNKPVGFSLEGSPLGDDNFDYFISYILIYLRNLKFKDVFTGFVFINSYNEQYNNRYITGFYKGIEQWYIQKAAIIENYTQQEAVSYIENYNRQALTDPITKGEDYKFESLFSKVLFFLVSVGLIAGLVIFLISRVVR
jgi:hypothetical protein